MRIISESNEQEAGLVPHLVSYNYICPIHSNVDMAEVCRTLLNIFLPPVFKSMTLLPCFEQLG